MKSVESVESVIQISKSVNYFMSFMKDAENCFPIGNTFFLFLYPKTNDRLLKYANNGGNMSIQYKFFMIPVKNNHEAEAELNAFLKGVRVVSIHREFVSQGNESFFSIILEYMEKQAASNASDYSKLKPRIDYREELSPENFAIFAQLREWRKETAAKESVPVYTIFKNDQLAQIIEKRILNKADLSKIEGVGEA
ncbi:HRDC domain-containing protein, partial [Candidatus Magnetomorum sp. HK-1]